MIFNIKKKNLIINILKSRLKSKFISNFIILLLGTGIASAIPIIVLPVLTRLWSPNDVGIFAVYIGVVGILSVLSAGRLDMAVIIEKKINDAKGILIIGLVLSFIFILLLYLVIFILDQVSPIFKFSVEGWHYLIPIGVFLHNSYSMMISWHNRNKNYKLISQGRVIQSTSISFAQIFTGLVTKFNFGLIFSDLAGRLLSIILIIKRTEIFKIKISNINYIALLKRYKKFPLIEVPASFVNVLSHQLPIIILPLIFSPAIAGLYFLAIKVSVAPSYLLGTALLEVFKNKAQDDFRRTGSCRPIFIKIGLTLFSIAIVPAILLVFFAPTLFFFVFGPQWLEAGEYVQILAPLALIQFVCSPLSYVLIFREKLSLDLISQAVFLILVIIALFIAAELKSIIATIWLLMISGVIFYLITLLFSYKNSKIKI
jgi:O-antigen/teichoic acid export membrane protein